MRIVFIRHGDPDYAHDTLTEKGRKEASLLAENIEYLGLEQAVVYVSPLGRARDTAGYVLERCHYRVEKETDVTIVCVCHLGIICALLSHLWSISPFILWHSLFLAPTSVSEVVTEERQQGVAYFRATRLGDIAHLRIGGEEPSFMARFCEVYSNKEQRH